MGWKKWAKRAVRVATAVSTFGGSEAARATSTTAKEKLKKSEEKVATEIGRDTVPGLNIAKDIMTLKVLDDPKKTLKKDIRPIMDKVSEGVSDVMTKEAAPELSTAPPELKESAADRAERERREFLQKKRAGERSGRGTGRTILTQRSGQAPSLLGGL